MRLSQQIYLPVNAYDNITQVNENPKNSAIQQNVIVRVNSNRNYSKALTTYKSNNRRRKGKVNKSKLNLLKGFEQIIVAM